MMNLAECKKNIISKFADEVLVLEDVETKKVTTFGLGTALPLLVEPQSVQALTQLLAFLKENKIAWYILGCGSNTVFPDEPLQKVVIRLGKRFNKACFWNTDVSSLYEQDNILESLEHFLNLETPLQANIAVGETVYALVFARTMLVAFANKMCANALAGLEYGNGIPSTIGGAVLINAGAHGWAIGSITEAVWILDHEGVLKILKKEDLVFSYRNSNIPTDAVVLAVLLKFTKDDPEQVQARRKHGLDYRKAHQPINLPSAGSIFKNPSGTTNNAQEQTVLPPAGKLIDLAGLKGFRVGGCEVSSLNANWIVKVDDSAKTSDLLEIMRVVREKVKEQSGIELQSEVKIL
ncbi:MAG: UDP-N-acetylmuramate dehydrogenase [Deltaproteobacteria bacterium]|jgi:UDP-N-acetylmuramate dehydrogenase|nr:UDP-N-acetylmuramate dehydrogenase [Deltaproteobacteria bacterium]